MGDLSLQQHTDVLSPNSHVQQGGGMLRIFIADDSELMRERIATILSELDGILLVGQAGDGQQAVEEIQRLQPDVAILDVRMPGANGIQALEAVKALANPPLVIMLTAFPYPQYRHKCLASGADYFFDKASEFDRVAHVIANLEKNNPCIPHTTPIKVKSS